MKIRFEDSEEGLSSRTSFVRIEGEGTLDLLGRVFLVELDDGDGEMREAWFRDRKTQYVLRCDREIARVVTVCEPWGDEALLMKFLGPPMVIRRHRFCLYTVQCLTRYDESFSLPVLTWPLRREPSCPCS